MQEIKPTAREQVHTTTKGVAGFRFSLRWLLIGVAAWAFGITALLNSTQAWLTIVVTVSALAWMIAVLLAVFATGPARAFAIGFALWAFLYLLLVHLFWEKEMHESKILVTSQLLDIFFTRVAKLVPTQNMFGTPSNAWSIDFTIFMTIGQLLWAWIVAVCGGFLAGIIYSRYHHDRGRG